MKPARHEQELAPVGLKLGNPDEVSVERVADQIDRHAMSASVDLPSASSQPGDGGLLNKSQCQER